MKTGILCIAASMLMASTAFGADKTIALALAGDSTVAEYKPESATRGWGQVIGGKFDERVAVKNFAVGGRSTKTFINEGRWDKLLASKPDFILLQFGHNDQHGPEKPESTNYATDYKDYLRKYADDAKSVGAQIIFVTSMHRRVFKNGKATEELLPYANAMKEVAKEKGIPCVDLNAASGELLNSLGDEPAADLYCSASDRTHFSAKGAEKMAGLIVEELSKTDSPLKAYLKK